MAEMRPDLMSHAGNDSDATERERPSCGQRINYGGSWAQPTEASPFCLREDFPGTPVTSTKWKIDLYRLSQSPLYEGEVVLFDRSFLEGAPQLLIGVLIPSGKHDARCSVIEAVDKRRRAGFSDGSKLGHPISQPGPNRSPLRVTNWEDVPSCRFGDREQVLVFVQNPRLIKAAVARRRWEFCHCSNQRERGLSIGPGLVGETKKGHRPARPRTNAYRPVARAVQSPGHE